MVKKILITGFPHCGTTILRAIYGNSNNILDIKKETKTVKKKHIKKAKKLGKEFILIKYPRILELDLDKYKNYFIIFIIRNPYYVYSSLNRRFLYKVPSDYKVENFNQTCKLFMKLKKKEPKRIFCIRYEDLFKDEFKVPKRILNVIGVNYDDSIFKNENKDNIGNGRIHIKDIDIKPLDDDHNNYRTWQINQPFKNSDNIFKLRLVDNQIKKFKDNYAVNQIYPYIFF